MKGKTLGILLIALAALAGVVFGIYMQQSPREGKREFGAPLFENLPVNDIAAVTILHTGDEQVYLARPKDRWIVKNRFGYPADFEKIRAFVRKLQDAKIGRSFEATKGVVERLHLVNPAEKNGKEEEKATAVVFADKEGKTLARVLMGAPMKGGQGGMFPQGQYVLLGKGKTVYLLDKEFEDLGKSPAEWLKKDLLDVREADVRQIACLAPDGKSVRFSFTRSAKGKDLEQMHPVPGKKIKASSLKSLAGALSNLRMNDVVDPAQEDQLPGMVQSPKLEYRLFDGMVYDLYPGKKCTEAGSCYLKITVRYENPGTLNTSQGKAEEDKKQEEVQGKLEQKARELNQELGHWTYVIPQWKHDNLVTDFESLLEKEKKK
jgi:hypothetical protein